MAITGHDVSNQSRNRRLLVLKEIFEEETDAEHGIAMKEIMSKLREYNIVAERRTIYEDIRVLQDVHKMDIEHHAGERIYRLKSRKFSLAEIKIIIDSMASSKALTPETTFELTNKLASLCSKHEREFLKKRVFLDGRVKSENKKVPLYIKTLNEGIIKQRWVAFRYFKYDINKKKVYYYGGKHRRVRPAALLVINDVYYLLGYDKRDKRKLYRVDRMSHVDIHSESFRGLPEKLDSRVAQLAFSVKDPYWTHKVEIEPVKLRFHISVVDEVLDKFGFAIQMIPDGENHFITTVSLEPTHDFYGWLFSFGRNAEILEPSIIRTSMYYKLRDGIYRYDK